MSFFDFGASGLLDTVTNSIFNGIAIKNAKEQSDRDFAYNQAIDQRNFDYTKSIDQRNFDYERALQQQIFNREDNAYQRAVADAQAAGLSKGVVSSGAGAGAVLGTSSSSYSGGNQNHTMDWSKLGNLATNLQQRKMNALSMKQMNAQYDISQEELKYVKYQAYNQFMQFQSNPFIDSNGLVNMTRLQNFKDSQFDTMMKEQEQKREAAQYYINHPWLSDTINFSKSIIPIVPKLF